MSLPAWPSKAELTVRCGGRGASNAGGPVRSMRPADASKLARGVGGCTQARRRWLILEFTYEPVCCVGVALVQHRVRIRPRRPVCCRRHPLSCEEAETPKARRQESELASSYPVVAVTGPRVAQQTGTTAQTASS